MFLLDSQKILCGIIKPMQPVIWRYCGILIAVGFQDWADQSSEQLHLSSVDLTLGRRLDKCHAGVPSNLNMSVMWTQTSLYSFWELATHILYCQNFMNLMFSSTVSN